MTKLFTESEIKHHDYSIEIRDARLMNFKDIIDSAVYDDGKLIAVNYDFNKITIETVANALSKICRFAGQLNHFYSVAEHSVNMCDLLDIRIHKLQALLHDASEMMIGDIPSPFKKLFPDIARVEEIVQFAIFKRFSVPFPIDKEVKTLDIRICASEAKEGGLRHFQWARMGITKVPNFDPKFFNCDDSKILFMERWKKVWDSLN